MAKVQKSLFRRISNWLHLWLGLASGIVVFIVCLTAAIWTFSEEFTFYLAPGQRIESKDQEFIKPSAFVEEVTAYYQDSTFAPHLQLLSVSYRAQNQSAYVSLRDTLSSSYKLLYLNPYTAEITATRDDNAVASFMSFLRSGHRFFWLPRAIGSPFVGASCIIFLITLITGLIWWYPNKWNKSTREKSFKIKWTANWKRVNIDLHNVLGFYTAIFAIILTVTGIVYSYKWFDEGYHAAITLGGERVPYPSKGETDTINRVHHFPHPDDELWHRYKQHGRISINYPKGATDVYSVYINPKGHNERTMWHSFDQQTLERVGGRDATEKLSLGQQIYEANYEIHTGIIGGLSTKIIASIVSLIGASLPVTGFIIWYNRKWGKKNKRIRKPNKQNS